MVVEKSELCFLSAAEMAPLIRTRAVSPVEIVKSFRYARRAPIKPTPISSASSVLVSFAGPIAA
jgi:hypothetical protein